jgi:hypothetical protein
MEGITMFRQGLVFVLAFGLLAGGVFAQPEKGKSFGPELNPHYVSINAVGTISAGEPARIEAFLKSWDFLDTVVVVFEPNGAIQYSGQTEWRQVVNAGDSIVFPLEVTFPMNDTTGFEIVAYKNGKVFLGDGFYVVSTEDPLKTFKFDPRKLPKETIPPSSEGYLREPHSTPSHDERGDTVKGTIYMPTDTDRMKEKERTPLTDADEQHILVDGEDWYRKRGEYEFKKLKKYANLHERVKAREAEVDEKYKNRMYETTMDLRDSADYAFAKSLFGDRLQPMDSAGFYHANISKAEGRPLVARKIRICLYPNYPLESHEPTPAEKH